MALKCANCDQIILPTDTVCWHCGKELKTTQIKVSEEPEVADSMVPEENNPISITAVSIFALITLITILLFILTTTLLANYT